jgi:NIPSNAP protein
MVVEMRTYSFFPGTTSQALARIARGVDERQKLSPLAGLWVSDIGRRHQIVHLWPYLDLAHREAVRARFGELKDWPARTGEYTAESETKMMRPAAFSPPLEPRDCGPVFEICTDTYKPQALEAIVALWRSNGSFAGLVGAWHTILGPMYQWIHMWAYGSLEERRSASGSLRSIGDEMFVKRESAVYFAAPFSPIQ